MVAFRPGQSPPEVRIPTVSYTHLDVYKRQFMGRVGPVSLAMSLTAKPDDNKRKIMPVGHINVG